MLTEIDLGDSVICDICNADWTQRLETGGFLFGSKGVCPECAPRFMAGIKRYGEENYRRPADAAKYRPRLVRLRACPKDKSFADWIRALRNGNNTVRIYSGD